MKIIGHRGAKGEAPENTIESIGRALYDGVDMVEFDLRLTRDGVVILCHDPILGGRRVARTDFLTLRQLKPDLATFSELLEIIDDHRKLYVEFKTGAAVAPALELLAAKFPNSKTQSEIFIASWFPSVLKKVRQIWSHAQLTLIVPSGFSLFRRAKKRLGLWGVVSWTKGRSRFASESVRQARKNGLNFYVGAIDNEHDLSHMKNLEVDGIITNFPARIVKLSRKKSR